MSEFEIDQFVDEAARIILETAKLQEALNEQRYKLTALVLKAKERHLAPRKTARLVRIK